MTIPLSVIEIKDPPLKPVEKPTRVHLGIPTYDGRIHEGISNGIFSACRTNILQTIQIQAGSWLTANFNTCFAHALNQRANGVTHFCLWHEDVIPQQADWLERMVKIMGDVKADVLSVVIPLKIEYGLTSTALDVGMPDQDPHWRVKRLTLNEVYNDYPATFTHEKLLLNTGMILIDIRKPWVENIWFEFEDKIIKNDQGQFVQRGVPEDWNFSRRARELGASLWATREVLVNHKGGGIWPNSAGWGTMKADEVGK